MFFKRKVLLPLSLFLFFHQQVFSQQDSVTPQSSKTLWYQSKVFKATALPVALIGLGITEINNHGIYSSYRFNNELRKDFPNTSTRLDDILPSMPVVLAAGLTLAGVKGKNTPLNAIIICVGASTISSLSAQAIKRTTHILRPDGSDYLSFPSGHTTAAFTAAEFLHQEYKDRSPWISVAGYTMATTVGAIRMLENHHWLSDVLAGAGLGMLSVRATYLVYPWIQKQLTKDKVEGLSFSPYYMNGNYGGSLVMSF